ncbi:hypothetical protein [Agrobacterium genomosp. 2]|nr:hypothetical protein [Agrobacterium genomosp. 2]
MNALYRNTLSAYGVRHVEYEAGLNGFPGKLVGLDAILGNLHSTSVVGPDGSVANQPAGLRDIVEGIKSNPILVVHNLAPEAELLSTVQEQDSSTYEIGQSGTASVVEYARGTPIPVAIEWTLETADISGQTATFSLQKTYDRVALQQSQASAVEGVISSFGEKGQTAWRRATGGRQKRKQKRADDCRHVTARWIDPRSDGNRFGGKRRH